MRQLSKVRLDRLGIVQAASRDRGSRYQNQGEVFLQRRLASGQDALNRIAGPRLQFGITRAASCLRHSPVDELLDTKAAMKRIG